MIVTDRSLLLLFALEQGVTNLVYTWFYLDFVKCCLDVMTRIIL